MNLRLICEKYNKEFVQTKREVHFEGSPQRSLRRFLLQSGSDFFVAEQIRQSQAKRREQIGMVLQKLRAKGGAVVPYLQTQAGGFVAEISFENGVEFWQIAPFVESVALLRPQYVFDGWRGKELALFLDLFTGFELEVFADEPLFFLQSYIRDLLQIIAQKERQIFLRAKAVFDKVADFLSEIEKNPPVFCHGDFHPLNVLWSKQGIIGVIDWEFCGYKNQFYDVANLVGCVGIEHPDFLRAELVRHFLANLMHLEILQIDFRFLPFFMIALRFAWLAEWLRIGEKALVRLEFSYMDFLWENARDLGDFWLQSVENLKNTK